MTSGEALVESLNQASDGNIILLAIYFASLALCGGRKIVKERSRSSNFLLVRVIRSISSSYFEVKIEHVTLPSRCAAHVFSRDSQLAQRCMQALQSRG